MFNNKRIKSMRLNDYFELRRPSYIYIKIIPHKSIRNYSSSNIAKAIASTYRTVNKQISIISKKLIVEKSHKVMYLIDIKATDTSFYFVVPKFFLNIALEKIHEVWTKATIEIQEKGIEPFSKQAECYSLSYKKHDALSLNVDKKLNEPLSSLLSVMDIMKENDRVLIAYNFLPKSQFAWLETFDDLERKVRKKECLDKPVFNLEYILKNATLNVIKVVDMFVDVFVELTGGSKEIELVNNYDTFAMLLSNSQDIEKSRYKKTSQVIDTQIAVISESIDDMRQENNALSVCQAYRNVDGDNEFKYKKISNDINLEDYSLNNCKKSALSTDESGQLIQVPGRMLLTSLGINHIKTEEVKVPEKLQVGKKRLGKCKFKGSITEAYLEDKYDIASLPLTLLGKMGGGKSTYLANFAKDCSDNGESVVLIDYIKSCGLSEEIKKVVPKEKIIELDLSNFAELQGFGFDELKVNPKATAFERLEAGNLQTIQLKSFINSIVVGDPLSSRMETILGAAGDIVFSLGYTAIKDVIKCLTCYKTRAKYIEELKLDKELFELLDEEVETLLELNEMSKVSVKESKEGVVSEVIGTRESKIEHILDRTRVLRSDAKLKLMYKKSTKDNVDLVKAMNEGKVILFKMPQVKFPSKHVKNIMVTYIMSKVWLACASRGATDDKPLPCNVLIDEIHQAPQVMEDLVEIIPQTRKFGCKLVFAIHNVDQVKYIVNTLESAGSSFMFLNGCLESDFNYFKSNLVGFEYEDLRDMERFHALNLVSYSEGYASFITKLPKPIKQEI